MGATRVWIWILDEPRIALHDDRSSGAPLRLSLRAAEVLVSRCLDVKESDRRGRNDLRKAVREALGRGWEDVVSPRRPSSKLPDGIWVDLAELNARYRVLASQAPALRDLAAVQLRAIAAETGALMDLVEPWNLDSRVARTKLAGRIASQLAHLAALNTLLDFQSGVDPASIATLAQERLATTWGEQSFGSLRESWRLWFALGVVSPEEDRGGLPERMRQHPGWRSEDIERFRDELPTMAAAARRLRTRAIEEEIESGPDSTEPLASVWRPRPARWRIPIVALAAGLAIALGTYAYVTSRDDSPSTALVDLDIKGWCATEFGAEFSEAYPANDADSESWRCVSADGRERPWSGALEVCRTDWPGNDVTAVLVGRTSSSWKCEVPEVVLRVDR